MGSNFFDLEELALIMVVSIEIIVDVRSVYVAGVWITESGLVVSIISIVVVVHILSISLRFSLSLSLENMTVVEVVVGVSSSVWISRVSIGLVSTGIRSDSVVVIVAHILGISLRFCLCLSLENMTVVEIVIDGGVRISSVSIGLILTGVRSVSREGVVCPVVLSISLWFSLSLWFSISLSLENTTIIEVVMDGGVRISSISIGLILTSVGSVSRKGVEYPVVLSISLWFSLSLSLENSTIVEVVIEGGVRISSVSIGLILTGVGSESREGVVCAVVLSVSLRFSLSLAFAPEMMYSRVCMSINLRLVDLVKWVDGICMCLDLVNSISQWGLNLELMNGLSPKDHWSLDLDIFGGYIQVRSLSIYNWFFGISSL
jgi:hypothetical protein